MPIYRFFVTLILVSLVSGCGSTSGVTVGGRSVSVPKVTVEEHQKLIDTIGIYDDVELAAYVEALGQRLVAYSTMPNGDFTFTLLDSPDINAFALPGGFIYVNRGLLAFLEDEEKLAGVIAHEIGHITENHHGRRQSQQMTSTVLSTTAYILTGSGDLYDATQMYGAELISGFGRDMELEADAAGATSMHRAGYDADALLSVIGVLKDQEMYRRSAAKASGKPSGSYHGLYASHPRNDLRLQTVIKTANNLDFDAQSENPAQLGAFRRHIEGLVFGASQNTQSEPNRFYHNKLDFSFSYPEGWSVIQGTRAVVAKADDGHAKLTIQLAKLDKALTPEEDLKQSASGELSDVTALAQFGLVGSSAVASAGGVDKRLAVIDHKYRFKLEGESSRFSDDQPLFSQMIESFRPLAAREKVTGTSRTLHYIQVPRGATLASLASSARIPNAEDQLRLINGYYPVGEPRVGDWIKIIR